MQPLARHLEEAEARDPSDLYARTIHFHGVAEAILDLALVTRRAHVDEVDDDEAADVTQPELASDLIRRFEVGIERRRFDVLAARRTGGVDVDRYQRFGVIDHDAA